MNLIILISFFLFVSVDCEHAKQSSELNYAIAKPETNILPPAPVNLVRYGPMAGYPIHALSYGPNIAYAKPIVKRVYGHHK